MKYLFPVVSLFLVTACRQAPPHPLTPAFFYWETTLNIAPAERGLMDSMGCKKLYVKVLDIGRNPETGAIEPYSRLEVADSISLSGLEIVPNVFITNEVFQGISLDKTEWLAGKIAESGPMIGPFQEFLLDCDWTPSTQKAFFLFLEKLRKKLPPHTRLCATIRLHQYKFPRQTGVPPVDRGMLMFYNTGDVDLENGRNSIFHPDDALKYLNGAPERYPLPLDLALPLFSWGLVFREGELWKIVPGPLPLEEMRRSGKYSEEPDTVAFAARLWEVKEGTFLGGHYLRPGDRLRVSAVSPEQLHTVAQLARRLDLADDASLAFFHLGIAGPEHFSATMLDSVCRIVR